MAAYESLWPHRVVADPCYLGFGPFVHNTERNLHWLVKQWKPCLMNWNSITIWHYKLDSTFLSYHPNKLILLVTEFVQNLFHRSKPRFNKRWRRDTNTCTLLLHHKNKLHFIGKYNLKLIQKNLFENSIKNSFIKFWSFYAHLRSGHRKHYCMQHRT